MDEMKKFRIAAIVFVIGALLATAATALAYEVISRSDHGETVQVNLRCNSGSKAIITYYKNSGEYCTRMLTCDGSMDKVARWACNE
jgi:hypothetical protein